MSAPATGCPVHAGFDPLGEEFLRDPFATMVELPPVFYAPSLDYYVVTRYADIERVFLDPETFSAATAQLPPLIPLPPEVGKTLLDGGHKPQPSMVSLDPPAHGRLRKPAARAFTPRRVNEMEPRIRQTAAELLDAVDASGPFDLIAALAFPLPMRIMFGFMGVPEADWAQLKEWCGSRASLAWGRPSSRRGAAPRAADGRLPAVPARARRGQGDRPRRRLRLRAARDPRRGPGGAHAGGDRLDPLLAQLRRARDHEQNLIGNCVRRLLEAPERWARLVDEPALIPGAVDEMLRFDPSVPVWRRVTKRPVTLGGVDLPEGAKLFLWLAAAGRDAEVFPEPERFDPERDNSRRTLAFGRGIHFCIGSALGRLEAALALEELTRRFPGLRLAPPDQEVPFHPNISFRGPQALWVEA